MKEFSGKGITVGGAPEVVNWRCFIKELFYEKISKIYRTRRYRNLKRNIKVVV